MSKGKKLRSLNAPGSDSKALVPVSVDNLLSPEDKKAIVDTTKSIDFKLPEIAFPKEVFSILDSYNKNYLNMLSGITNSMNFFNNFTESIRGAAKMVNLVNEDLINIKPNLTILTESFNEAIKNIATIPTTDLFPDSWTSKITYIPPPEHYTHELQRQQISVQYEILDELKTQRLEHSTPKVNYPRLGYPGKRIMMKEVSRMTKQCDLSPAESALLRALSTFLPHTIKELASEIEVKDVKHAKETLNKKLAKNNEPYCVIRNHGGGFHDSTYILRYSPTSEVGAKN